MESEQHEVKRLKFSKEDEEEEDDDEDEEEEQEVDTLRPLHATSLSKEAEAMVQDNEEKVGYSMENEASSSATVEDQGIVFRCLENMLVETGCVDQFDLCTIVFTLQCRGDLWYFYRLCIVLN